MKPQTNAQLLRKIERLEAQLKAAEALNQRIGTSDYAVVLQNADMRVRLAQIAEMASLK